MKRPRLVPVWLTVLAVLLGLFSTSIGVSALINPELAIGYVPGAEDLATTWAGRNAGLGVVLLVAVLLRRPEGYVVAFSGPIMREVSDILVRLPTGGGATPFLVLDVICLAFAVRAVRQLRAREADVTAGVR